MKSLTSTLLVLGLSWAILAPSAHAELDLGTPTSRTPYDAYLNPMWAVLRHLSGTADPGLVAELVRRGRNFNYRYNKEQPYVPQTPEETEALKAGDCKAKSLWLASKLNDRNIRFVVGKAKGEATMGHAWLIWNGPEGWRILDATLFSAPLTPARLSPTEFIPRFSYGPSGKFRHSPASAASGSGAKSGDHL